MKNQDCLDEFISEKCKVDQNKSTLFRDLYDAYREYCKEQGSRIRSAKNFSVSLISRLSLTKKRVAGGFYTLEGISL